MMTYRLATKGVTRIADDLAITRDMPEWEDYRQWLKTGGVPAQAIIETAPRWTSLDAAMLDVWERTKRKRDNMEASGFPYLGKIMDSDPRAVMRIVAAVQAAQAAIAVGEPFQIDWTAKDGTAIKLDAAGMVGMPAALAIKANQLHQEAKAFKTRIHAAADFAELEALDQEVAAWT
jgi:hypothetical protein